MVVDQALRMSSSDMLFYHCLTFFFFAQQIQNAMISSIVQVTNLPRKRIVKWFEDKRVEDGVPDPRLPFDRSSPQSA